MTKEELESELAAKEVAYRALKVRVDLLSHENTHYQQTIRSLHYALNVAVGQLRTAQLGMGEFGEDKLQFRREVALAV